MLGGVVEKYPKNLIPQSVATSYLAALYYLLGEKGLRETPWVAYFRV